MQFHIDFAVKILHPSGCYLHEIGVLGEKYH